MKYPKIDLHKALTENISNFTVEQMNEFRASPEFAAKIKKYIEDRKRKKLFKKKLSFISHMISFGLMINLFVIFIKAYFNDYQIGVYVNNYGEAHFEMILFPVTIIICMIGLYFTWRDLKNVVVRETKNKKRKDAETNTKR